MNFQSGQGSVEKACLLHTPRLGSGVIWRLAHSHMSGGWCWEYTNSWAQNSSVLSSVSPVWPLGAIQLTAFWVIFARLPGISPQISRAKSSGTGSRVLLYRFVMLFLHEAPFSLIFCPASSSHLSLSVFSNRGNFHAPCASPLTTWQNKKCRWATGQAIHKAHLICVPF